MKIYVLNQDSSIRRTICIITYYGYTGKLNLNKINKIYLYQSHDKSSHSINVVSSFGGLRIL